MSDDVFEQFQDSPLYAEVKKVPLEIVLKEERHIMKDSAVITLSGKPLCIVRKSYPLIETPVFLEQLESVFLTTMTESQLRGVEVVDAIRKDGAWMQRSYLFPAIGNQLYSVGGEQHIGYRCILTNSYNGRSSTTLATGLIDYVCLNGMIVGKDIEVVKTRHSRGFDLALYSKVISSSINNIQREIQSLQNLADKEISEEYVESFLKRAMGPQLGAKLLEQFQSEIEVRGRTLWAAMSALTFYSSHSSERFPIRAESVDYRLFKRQEEVRRLFNSPMWAEFKEAA